MAMRFRQAQKIAVIGDLMLDEFVYGSVKRLNPEAPVPVLNIKNREYRLGGAANVAANIRSLGGDCLLLGRVGNDQRIKVLLDQMGINHCLIVDENLSTAIKTRFVTNNQQLLRVDDEKIMPLDPSQINQILGSIQGYDIFLIADYGKGVITQGLMNSLRDMGKMILVDPKDLIRELFGGVFLIKPNLLEAQKWVSAELDSEGTIEKAGSSLQKAFDSKVLLTRGKEGISLFQSGREPLHFPGQAREVYDVSGAGDTVIATVGLCLASGIELEEAIVLANSAAGIVVGKLGTAVVTAKELFASVEHENHKVKTDDEIPSLVKDLRKREKKIVFTNGCFDILHVGHTKLLKKARSLGDVLILGLNSDGSIKRLKGPHRPIMGEDERADILASLECVDYVIFFDEDDPCNLISMIKPDIHVKGGDYTLADNNSMPEAKLIEEYGGKVVLVNYIEGKSTSAIIEKIKTR
jgi:D-beta-D-heptose 7-phosphate kinase/D-beta-D-heptose 1-phosphate adenosyltransferase